MKSVKNGFKRRKLTLWHAKAVEEAVAIRIFENFMIFCRFVVAVFAHFFVTEKKKWWNAVIWSMGVVYLPESAPFVK